MSEQPKYIYDSISLEEEALNIQQVEWQDFIERLKKGSPEQIKRIQQEFVYPESPHKKFCFQLFHVLSIEECQDLIARTEQAGYKALVGYQTSYRSNWRVIIELPEVADILFQRVKAFLPLEVKLLHPPGTWQCLGLNYRFRFCRYKPTQLFAAHRDGDFVVSPTEKSLLTFMIYLSDNEQGGSTNFLYPDGKVKKKIPPKPGMVLIFDHNMFHEGAKLEGGLKYLMRTDIMYKRIKAPVETNTPRDRALRLIGEVCSMKLI